MTAEQVRQEVISEKKAGYDFIKVHGDLTKEAYDALLKLPASRTSELWGMCRAILELTLRSMGIRR